MIVFFYTLLLFVLLLSGCTWGKTEYNVLPDEVGLRTSYEFSESHDGRQNGRVPTVGIEVRWKAQEKRH